MVNSLINYEIRKILAMSTNSILNEKQLTISTVYKIIDTNFTNRIAELDKVSITRTFGDKIHTLVYPDMILDRKSIGLSDFAPRVKPCEYKDRFIKEFDATALYRIRKALYNISGALKEDYHLHYNFINYHILPDVANSMFSKETPQNELNEQIEKLFNIYILPTISAIYLKEIDDILTQYSITTLSFDASYLGRADYQMTVDGVYIEERMQVDIESGNCSSTTPVDINALYTQLGADLQRHHEAQLAKKEADERKAEDKRKAEELEASKTILKTTEEIESKELDKVLDEQAVIASCIENTREEVDKTSEEYKEFLEFLEWKKMKNASNLK